MNCKSLNIFLPLLESGFIDDENRTRLLKKKGNAQLQSLALHLLNRYAIAKFLNLESFPHYINITYTKFGKPQVLNRYGTSTGINISCSHTNGNSGRDSAVVACAVSEYPIGIDIEKPRIYLDKVSKRMFTDKEYESLQGSSCKDHDFTKLWTLREAYAKLSGLGLSKMPKVEFLLYNKDIFCSDKSVYPITKNWADYVISIISRVDKPISFSQIDENDIINWQC